MLSYIFDRPVIFQSWIASIGARIQLVPIVFRIERERERERERDATAIVLVANFSRVEASSQRYSVGGTSCRFFSPFQLRTSVRHRRTASVFDRVVRVRSTNARICLATGSLISPL